MSIYRENKHLFLVLLFLSLTLYHPMVYGVELKKVNIEKQADDAEFVKRMLVRMQGYIDKSDYNSAWNLLDKLQKDYPNNSDIKEWIAKREKIIAKEKEAYEKACCTETKEALQDFIFQYPNSEYAHMAIDKIADFDLWQQTRTANTTEAYKHYLSISSILAYKDEANVYINNLQEEQDWIKCKDAEDENLLNNFITTYPNSSNINEAKYRLNILKGKKYNEKGYDAFAYSYFKEANDYMPLSGKAAQDFQELQEKREYREVISSTDKARVKRYLNSLPTSSPYYNTISNQYAILLAKDLSAYSTEYFYNEALSYAKDRQTKETVKTYINNSKKQKSYYKHQHRVFAHKRWWKDRFKVGWNVAHFDILKESMSVGTGIKFRLGRWSDVFNFLFGAEYSYVMWKPEDSYYDYETYSMGHQIEIPATLRFNIFNVSRKSKFYVGCSGIFGFKIADGELHYMSSTSIAIQPELGFAGNHWDFGLYYRTYFSNYNIAYPQHYEFENKRIGCFFTWFF